METANTAQIDDAVAGIRYFPRSCDAPTYFPLAADPAVRSSPVSALGDRKGSQQ